MRAKGTTIQQLLLGLALLAGLLWNLAHAGEVRTLQLSSGSTGTRAEIALDKQAEYKLITLANPDRLVVDLPGAKLAGSFKLPTPAGLVKAVRNGQPTPGTTRLVFDLSESVVALKPRFESGPGGVRLVLEWPGEEAPPSVAATPQAAPQAPAPDPTAAASAATSRLIASLPQPRPEPQPSTTDAATAATAHQVSAAATSSGVPAAQPPATASASQAPPPADILAGTATVTPLPPVSRPANEPSPAVAPTAVAKVTQGSGTIATGVPTRIATGVPTRITPATPAGSAAVASQPSAATSAPVIPAAKAPAGTVKSMQDVMRRGGLRPLVIAIDAGHGGQDSGARGPSGTLEKNITLQVARELARQVNATPGLKAYLTRDTDFFIPLAQRYQKARAAKADLFVSIHADAFTNSTASGSSVFVLSQRGASSQAAKWLAGQENAADLVGGVKLQDKDNTLASVLLDLSQSATMKASEDMANHVLDGLRQLGKTHKKAVERANFVVLRSPDVPSMLVETAFITNPEEERKLRDPAHQGRLATAILNGVNTYFTRQPPPGTLYAARAEAAAQGNSKGGSP